MKKRKIRTPNLKNAGEIWEKIASVQAKMEESIKNLDKLKVHIILLKNGIEWDQAVTIRKKLPTKPGSMSRLLRSPSQEEWLVTDAAGRTTIIKNPWDIPKGKPK